MLHVGKSFALGDLKSPVFPLQAILKGLVLWIVSTSAAAQRVRANLYGALLNYLRIGKVASGQLERNSDEEKLKKEAYEEHIALLQK